ncbi:MAG: 7-cyano-7-deazaguanine synthase [Candidatus Gastranaerophilaceae bacterium]
MNQVLKTSTNEDIKVLAPLIGFDKNEIVKKAVEINAPLHLINSCYNDTHKHCGRCESCNRLKRALEHNGYLNIIKELFE